MFRVPEQSAQKYRKSKEFRDGSRTGESRHALPRRVGRSRLLAEEPVAPAGMSAPTATSAFPVALTSSLRLPNRTWERATIVPPEHWRPPRSEPVGRHGDAPAGRLRTPSRGRAPLTPAVTLGSTTRPREVAREPGTRRAPGFPDLLSRTPRQARNPGDECAVATARLGSPRAGGHAGPRTVFGSWPRVAVVPHEAHHGSERGCDRPASAFTDRP